MVTYGPWIQPPDFSHNANGGNGWRGGGATITGPPGAADPDLVLNSIELGEGSETPATTGMPARPNIGYWNITASLGDPSAPTIYSGDRFYKEFTARVGVVREATGPSSLAPGAISYELEHPQNTVASAILTLHVGSYNYDTSGGGNPVTGVGAPPSSAEWSAKIVHTTPYYPVDANWDEVIYDEVSWLGRPGASGPVWRGQTFATTGTPVGEAHAVPPIGVFDVTAELGGRTFDGRSVDGLFSLAMFHQGLALPSLVSPSADERAVMFGHDLHGSMVYSIRPARYRFIFPDEPEPSVVSVLRRFPRDDPEGFGGTQRVHPEPRRGRVFGNQP